MCSFACIVLKPLMHACSIMRMSFSTLSFEDEWWKAVKPSLAELSAVEECMMACRSAVDAFIKKSAS